MITLIKKIIKKIPRKPGAYLFKNTSGRILYIGKAIDLKKRVQQHFSKKTAFFGVPFIDDVADIDWIRTKNEQQAMLLENQLIKKYQPRYNIQWRDDKSYFWVLFTDDEWPRVVVVHKNKINPPQSPFFKRGSTPLCKRGVRGDFIGPFVSGRELRKTLRALRKILPFRTCKNPYEKPCLQWHLGLCPAHGQSDKPQVISDKIKNYTKSIDALSQFLRLYAGEKLRIEAYDISNIQGKYATGSMIVFYGDKPSKADYRKFRIKTVAGANDIAMVKEVLSRRLNHAEWPYPDLILIDGGIAQLHAAISSTAHRLPSTAIISLAKREEEIYTEFKGKPLKLSSLPLSLKLIFQHIRDEAHRFAIFYYRYLHRKNAKNPITKKQ